MDILTKIVIAVLLIIFLVNVVRLVFNKTYSANVSEDKIKASLVEFRTTVNPVMIGSCFTFLISSGYFLIALLGNHGKRFDNEKQKVSFCNSLTESAIARLNSLGYSDEQYFL